MNPQHYLAHVLLAYHPPRHEPIDVSAAVKEHFRKALSAETVTATLRERLARRRAREAVHDELLRLERELLVIGELRDDRIDKLREKVQELKKKVGPTGPLP